jgi:general bacterial porin, GBP family
MKCKLKLIRSVVSAAVVFLWAGASYAQSSVTLYGIIDTAVIYGNSEMTAQGGHSASAYTQFPA